MDAIQATTVLGDINIHVNSKKDVYVDAKTVTVNGVDYKGSLRLKRQGDGSFKGEYMYMDRLEWRGKVDDVTPAARKKFRETITSFINVWAKGNREIFIEAEKERLEQIVASSEGKCEEKKKELEDAQIECANAKAELGRFIAMESMLPPK